MQRRIATLEETWGQIGTSDPRPPLIVIPGAFGSRLMRRSTREEIWPGSNMSLVFSRFRDIELEIDARTLEPVTRDVETSGLILQALGRDFYGDMLQVLEVVGGYRRGSVTRMLMPSPRTYYVYEYDWRLDTVASARGLHELIERIAEIHGPAGRQVDIVAHSNGGLIARYYARYGTADVLDGNAGSSVTGSDRIGRLLLAGTPNLGTIQAVLSHVRGEEVGLRRIPAEVVATCPSVPQLMPHPAENWLVNLRGEPVGIDMYDIETWRELRWSIFSDDARDRIARRSGDSRAAAAHLETLEAYLARHLERGRRFHEALSSPPRPGEPLPHVVGSDCKPTLARLVVERFGRSYRAHALANRIAIPSPDVDYVSLLNEPGDGVVTRSSLLRAPQEPRAGIGPLDTAETLMLCESHQSLTGHLEFQHKLLGTLLEPA